MQQLGLERLQAINDRGQCRPIFPGRTIFGRGANLSDVMREDYLGISDEIRGQHIGVMGTTGAGKTRLMEYLVEQDIRKGHSVVLLDPKGDIAMFSKFIQVAAESGRLDDVMFLTPIFPDLSVMLDPLANYYMEDELVSHVTSGVDPKDPYYLNIAREVSQYVIAGLVQIAKAQGEVARLTFMDVQRRIGFDELKGLRDSLQMVAGTEEIVEGIGRMVHAPNLQEFYSKVSSSLRTVLSSLTFGSTGQIIGKASTNEFIDRVHSGRPVLTYVNTGSVLTQKTGHIIGKVFMSMVQSQMGRFFASGKKFSPPLCLYIDEGDLVLYPGIENLFNKGRAGDVWITFMTQSMAQMDAAVGEKMSRSLVDNVNTWAYFRVNHSETAEHIQATSPEIQKHDAVWPLGASSITMRTVSRPRIEASRILKLEDRWFYFRSFGHYGKGRTLDVEPAYVKIKFPEMDTVGIRPVSPA